MWFCKKSTIPEVKDRQQVITAVLPWSHLNAICIFVPLRLHVYMFTIYYEIAN